MNEVHSIFKTVSIQYWIKYIEMGGGTVKHAQFLLFGVCV